MKLVFSIVLALCSMSLSANTAKQEVIKLQTTISGNNEEPKLLSILPWQDLDPVQVKNAPFNQYLQKQFKPIDPATLANQLALHKQLQGQKAPKQQEPQQSQHQ